QRATADLPDEVRAGLTGRAVLAALLAEDLVGDTEGGGDLTPARLLDARPPLDLLVVLEGQQTALDVLELLPGGQYLLRGADRADDADLLGRLRANHDAVVLRLDNYHGALVLLLLFHHATPHSLLGEPLAHMFYHIETSSARWLERAIGE